MLPSPFDAVLASDAAALEQLLAATPELAHARMPRDVLVAELPHWLYADDTPLHLAAAALDAATARVLLEHGADPHATNRRGATALHYACDARPASASPDQPERQRDVLDVLIEAGADVNWPDRGGATPLHRAVRARSPGAVAALLAAGARVDVRLRARGSTPLDLSRHTTGAGGTAGTQTARDEIVELLVAHGALRYTSTSDPPGQ